LSSTADGPKPSSPAKESEAGEVIKKDPPIVFNIFLKKFPHVATWNSRMLINL
jgi:hypothetical protein